MAARRWYYNPKLDPRTQAVKMTPAMREAVRDGKYDDGTAEQGGPLNNPDGCHPANLVSSMLKDGSHAPALDIDIPCELIPSSTPGHAHLYFPTLRLTWDQYVTLLAALAEAGIIEERYFEHSIKRGQTLLRPPWVPK